MYGQMVPYVWKAGATCELRIAFCEMRNAFCEMQIDGPSCMGGANRVPPNQVSFL
jgi:hypothetical protein